MIKIKNILKLMYYKLLIKILDKFTKTKFCKKSYGYPIEYKMNHRILQLSVKYNILYTTIYPEQVTIECLEACGISEFEKLMQEPVLFIQDNKLQKIL